MSTARRARESKRQLGQFITPVEIAAQIVAFTAPQLTDKILEPSFGNGSFLIALLDYFKHQKSVTRYTGRSLYGVEIDDGLFDEGVKKLNEKYSASIAKNVHLYKQDFFRWSDASDFDLIIGNPPFGGTFDSEIEDDLDRQFGERLGYKIKKETYAFFIIKSLDLLKDGGRLVFICSDTFLTINTMKGLRNLLMKSGSVEIHNLSFFSEETTHPMVVINFVKGKEAKTIKVDDKRLLISDISKTPNLSWKIDDELLGYFSGKLLGEFVVATSGMTIGKNEYFLKTISEGKIIEKYKYEYVQEPISLARELKKARLGKISIAIRDRIREQVHRDETEEILRVLPLARPKQISLPHPDYAHYNKGQTALLYAEPQTMIYWADDGKAVYTYKNNGAWYLHGVGGKKFFGREGLTWQLVASKIYARYLPSGFIFDSGAPCAFLREGIPHDELYFILGWLVTERATKILKTVLNHTRNIQSKDIERMPYPSWVGPTAKLKAIALVKKLIGEIKRTKHSVSTDKLTLLEELYAR